MIDIYLYTSNLQFKNKKAAGDINAYLQFKKIPDKSQSELDALDYLINNELQNICFGFTEKEEDVLSFYFDDIVVRQNRDVSSNFIVRARSINIIRYAVDYVRNGIIKPSFIRINVEGIEVSFDNNNFLTSKDCVLEKILNWKNYEE